MTKATIALRTLGQSIWLDQISRALLTSGEFQRLVTEEGVMGVTSNPTIFDKAITGSGDYDDQLTTLSGEEISPAEVFVRVAAQDLRQAADILRPHYDSVNGNDGFVSMECAPDLANDTEGTIAEVHHLWGTLDRPNAMIKIPGTRAGLPAIEAMIAEGININITLLFSVARYEQVIEAYLAGLERRLAEGKRIDRIRSVASFFVSRVDTLVDRRLTERMESASPDERTRLESLRSTVAIANAKIAYQRFKETFTGPRWETLQRHGAALQRPLWASTSTKDPRLPDTYYVDALIGPHTVNTVPVTTLKAFSEHGTVAATLEQGVNAAQEVLDRLAAAGIDLVSATDQLEVEGVRSFSESYASLIRGIEDKLGKLRTARAQAALRPS
jgi:transaldolase